MDYKSGFKYQLVGDEYYQTNITGYFIKLKWLTLSLDGMLCIKDGYAWDGATMFPDIPSIIRGSLIHDALYELLRKNYIHKKYKSNADLILKYICLEDGMWEILTRFVHMGVKFFGKTSTLARSIKEIKHV